MPWFGPGKGMTLSSPASDFQEIDFVEGYDCRSSQFFKTDLIQEFIDLPLDNVNMDYVRKHPLNTQSQPLNFLF